VRLTLLSASLCLLLLSLSPVQAAGPISAWQDAEGHLWVETDYYRWDVSHGSSCLVKLGAEPRDWAIENVGEPEVDYGQTTGTFQWSVYLGQGGGNLLAPGEYAAGEYLQSGGAITSATSETVTIDFYRFLLSPAGDFPVATTMTFRADRPVVAIEYSVGPVFSDPYPPAIEYALTLVPGGDRVNDFLYWSGRGGAAPFPYDSWAGPVTADQIEPVIGADGQQYAFITGYDTAAGQGLAYFARLDRTADFVTDLNYGRMAAYDTRLSWNFCYLALTMDATQHGPLSILFYEPDPVTPWLPVEAFIAAHGGAEGPLAAAFEASPTAGPVPLLVSFVDLSQGAPTSWSWDFGDGGTAEGSAVNHVYTTPGRYTVTLVVANPAAESTLTRDDLILATFLDVPLDQWALDPILACVGAGIVEGYDDGSYHPAEAVNRAQMAVYIARALAGGEANVPTGPAEVSFPDDVPAGYWAYKYVAYAVEAGVVQGYDETHYGPDTVVTRDQMAAFVARAKGWVSLGEALDTAEELFSDVPAGFWSGVAVQACVAHGVVNGYSDGTYHPEREVTRDQMAVYVARAFELL
jgi:PKD repeat protein